MQHGIVFAGFGGQGILLAGKLLCLAAMAEGRQVSHIPSYGAEMRGGTANCSVVISDSEIASPLVPHPQVCVVMNKPSLIKFAPRLSSGGLLLYNRSLIDVSPDRADVEAVPVRANELAQEEGSDRAANMIMLGLLSALRPALAGLGSLVAALDQAVSARNRRLNEVNARCLRRGFALA